MTTARHGGLRHARLASLVRAQWCAAGAPWAVASALGEAHAAVVTDRETVADPAAPPGALPSLTIVAGAVAEALTTADQQPLTRTVDGVARPTVSATGVPLAATAAGHAAAWGWLGDAATVDDAGRPIVLYHGSGQPIATFACGDPAATPRNGNRTSAWGSSFTPRATEAAIYAEMAGGTPTVTAVCVAIRSPYVMGRAEWGRHTQAANAAATPAAGRALALAVRHRLEAAGHDGLVIRDRGFHDEWVAFHPAQVRTLAALAAAHPSPPPVAPAAWPVCRRTADGLLLGLRDAGDPTQVVQGAALLLQHAVGADRLAPGARALRDGLAAVVAGAMAPAALVDSVGLGWHRTVARPARCATAAAAASGRGPVTPAGRAP